MREHTRRKFLTAMSAFGLGTGLWLLGGHGSDVSPYERTPEPTPPTKPMPAFETAPTEYVTEDERSEVERLTMKVTNEARKVTHRDQLKRFSENLAYIARLHSRDMAEEGYVAHEDKGPKIQYGETHYDRLAYFGYNNAHFTAVENLTAFTVDVDSIPREIAEKAVHGFMTSPPHREAMLNSDYDTMGVGCHLSTKYQFEQKQQPYLHVHLTELLTAPAGPSHNDPKWRS